MKKKKVKLRPVKLMGNILVCVYALILTVPFYFVIMTAFKSEQERIVNPVGLPIKATWENFSRAWIEGGLVTATVNSVIVTFGTVALLLCSVILVSYCLNRIRDTKIGVVIYMYILVAMFIPGVGTPVLISLRRDLGLYNNLLGEIICSGVGITSGVFIVSGFLRTIPRDLEEAAVLDGANDFQICTKVIVPLILPALMTVGILAFTGTWNNTLGPMLTLRSKELFTIPMALYLNFTTEISAEYSPLFAGVIMTCIPIIIVYCKCQKYFMSALGGAVKG